MLSPIVDAWPLVGREGELERIAQARADGECPGVVVSAVAGVGKSRLAREALAAAQREGAVIHWAQATTSAAAVPLGAFAGLVPDEVRSDEPLELMRRSAEALGRRTDGRMVVVGVDDAQLLDPVSAALVLHLTVYGQRVRAGHGPVWGAVPRCDRVVVEGRRCPADGAGATR